MMRASVDTSAYACRTASALPYSRRAFFANSLCRTGRGLKMPRTVTVVPTARAAVDALTMAPARSYSSLVPASSRSVRVTTVRLSESAQSDESASPRNPNEPSDARSSKVAILLVAYLTVRAWWFSGATPEPLSATSMVSAPWSFSRTSMLVAPASSAFSTSSFTAPARSRTTWPLQMRWMCACAMGRMALPGAGGVGPETPAGSGGGGPDMPRVLQAPRAPRVCDEESLVLENKHSSV